MKKIKYLFIVVTLIFTACNSSNNNSNSKNTDSKSSEHSHSGDDHSGESHSIRNVETSSEKSALLSNLIDTYIQLKNALATDNEKEAAAAANGMLQAFEDIDMDELSDTQHDEYMEIYENSKEQLEHIVKSPIDHQREHFEVLSTDLNDLITLIGTDQVLYRDFCPMYNSGKGATWISEKEGIENPYYGSKMFNCGKIQDKIN